MAHILGSPRLTARPCFAGLLVKSAFQISSLYSDNWNVDFRHHQFKAFYASIVYSRKRKELLL